jgi:hypothetical protein
MSDFSRGRDIQIQVVSIADDGSIQIENIGNPTSGNFNMDVTNERDNRLGEYEADTTQVYEGESGNLTFRVDSHVLNDIKMRIRNAARDKLRTPKFQIVRTIYVPEIASSKAYLYPNCVFGFSESISGKNDAVETTVEFMSGFAEEIEL